MKKSLVARGFVGAVASLLGVMAVGCGAEVGDGAAGDSAEIGSTEQAITASMAASRSALWDACRLSVGGSELILTAAGASNLSGSTVAADIYLAVQGTGWVTPTGTTSLSVARKNHRLITDPADSTSCLVLGGEPGSGAAVSGTNDKAYRLTVTKPGASYNIAVASITGLTPRAQFQVAKCGSNSVVVYGGEDNGSAVANGAVEVLTSGASAFSSVTVTNNPAARFGSFGFALINDGTDRNFVAAAGDNGGAVGRIDVFKFNSDCTTVTTTNIGNMNTPVKNAVAFESDLASNISTIRVPGGINTGSTSLASLDTFQVDMSNATPALVANSATTTSSALQGTTSDMRLVIKPSTKAAYIIGGVSGATRRAYVSKFTYGGSSFSSLTALSTARTAHAVTYLPTADVLQVLGGNDGLTPISSAEEITP